MSLRFPKSVADSQQFVGWAFPLLLAYGVASLPAASWMGRIALILGLVIIITGWQSFGVLKESAYNDVLLFTDLNLLACYWLFLYYAQELDPNVSDGTLYNISGIVFLLYAIWDAAALAGRDTSAFATAAHLYRFAWITFSIGILFLLLGIISSKIPKGEIDIVQLLRAVGLGIWCVIIVWWQIGRFIAALRDTR